MLNYGVILASGTGSRMKNLSIPKQYYKINNIPIIIYTLRRMLETKLFDKIYIAISKEYIEYMKEIIKKYVVETEQNKIFIVIGGKERIDTIHNVIEEVKKNIINEDDVIVIHDAVRPFVTEEILKSSIKEARKYGATVAAVPVSDTMLMSEEGKYVDSIPNRSTLYKGQAPDSFKLKIFIELENKLTEEQKKVIVGTSQICTMNNYPIKIIKGDNINFKITTDADLEIAKSLILRK